MNSPDVPRSNESSYKDSTKEKAEFLKQMRYLIEDNIPYNKFLTLAFTTEIFIQFIFPYPNVESIVFIG